MEIRSVFWQSERNADVTDIGTTGRARWRRDAPVVGYNLQRGIKTKNLWLAARPWKPHGHSFFLNTLQACDGRTDDST